MASREIDWRSLVLKADPEHNKKNTEAVEYEFSAPAGRSANQTEKTFDGGFRVFRGNYRTRGPYSS